jgi:acetyltransferase-like isoleucine patch superfamily enzyme
MCLPVKCSPVIPARWSAEGAKTMTAGTRLEHDWFPEPLPHNVVIGEGSWLHSSYGFLHYRSRRQTGVRIGAHSGVYIGSYFELGPDGEVDIGDYCSIVGATFVTNGRIEVHDYAFLAHEVMIADSPFATPPVDERQDPRASSTIVIGENAWIGARATILAGSRLGKGAIVGAGAVVSSVIPDYAIAAGNPARVVGRAAPHTEL